MNTFLYIIIFMIGTVFGSFFTLAVYRIPLKQDILYTHSYCPNCKNKLGFLELIPVLSYILLGGKCKHCGQKIRIRYLLLEVLSGLTFVLLALSFDINLYNLSLNKIIYFSFFSLFIATLFIIAGIDKENIKIEKSVLVFGLFLETAYMVYVCITTKQIIYTYIILLAINVITITIDTLFLKNKLEKKYGTSILLYVIYILVFASIETLMVAIAIFLVIFGTSMIIKKLKNKQKQENLKAPIGFYLAIANIISLIICNFIYLKL